MLRRVGLMDLVKLFVDLDGIKYDVETCSGKPHFLSCRVSIQGRQLYSDDFVNESLTLVCARIFAD